MDLKKITSPTLLLDENKCRLNIANMADKIAGTDVIFRPHFKTHQSLEIGRWFRKSGVECITVSSVAMAEYFSCEWKDITIAFPVNLREIDNINKLNSRIKLNVFISDIDSIEILEKSLQKPLEVFIKIDTGYHRAGIHFEDHDLLDRILGLLHKSAKLSFMGFATHSGNTYKAGSHEEIIDIFNSSRERLLTLKSRYITSFPAMILSVGDTPSLSIVNDLNNIDEIRPGNFVFYDLMQSQLGSCMREQLAVALACPVVSKNHKKKEILVYGGAIHLSKEKLSIPGSKEIFGLAVYLNEHGWQFPETDVPVVGISQEHGIIAAGDAFFNKINTGDLIGIIPVHSCLTANLMQSFRTLSDNKIPMMPQV